MDITKDKIFSVSLMGFYYNNYRHGKRAENGFRRDLYFPATFFIGKGWPNFEGSERSTALSEDMLDYMIDRALNHSGQKIKRP